MLNPESQHIPGALDAAQMEAMLADPNSTFIDDIPARPGHVQKWIRVTLAGEDDARNVGKMQRLGWKPREASTVPNGYSPPTIRNTALGDVIGVGDLVLFEIPEILAQRYRSIKDAKLQQQMQAVNMQRARDTGDALTEVNHRSTATPIPTIADD
jgi:hypothetical protein